jgi:hypothetical protein
MPEGDMSKVLMIITLCRNYKFQFMDFIYYIVHPTVEPMFDDLLRLHDNQDIFELRLTICYFQRLTCYHTIKCLLLTEEEMWLEKITRVEYYLSIEGMC